MKPNLKAKLLVSLILIPLVALAQQPVVLKSRAAPATYALLPGAQKVFSLSLIKNKTYLICAEQKGIDISLALNTKSGRLIKYQNAVKGIWGAEIINWTSDTSATFKLHVTRVNNTDTINKGRFSIMLDETLALDSSTHIYKILSSRQMKEDLKLFRAIRDSANPGLYRYRSHKQIDSIYAWADQKILKPLSVLEFYRLVVVLTDFEGSCHNWTGLQYDTKYYLERRKGFFPYSLKNIHGEIRVNNAGGKIQLGSRILSVNGVSDVKLLHSLYKYRTTDGYNLTEKQSASIAVKFGINYQIEYGVKDHFKISYSVPGSKKVLNTMLNSVSLDKHDKIFATRNSLKFENALDYERQGKYSFKQIDDSTAVLNLRIFSMAPSGDQDPEYKVFCHYLDSMFRAMKMGNKIKHLVIDVRGNPGGNDPTYEKVFSYLTSHTFKENSLAYVNFIKVPFAKYYDWDSPDTEIQQNLQSKFEDWLKDAFSVHSNGKYYQNQKYNPVWYPDTNRFKGKMYLLIDEYMASAGSHFASLVKGYTNAIIVGVETDGGYYGHNGHVPIQYALPNSKIKTKFSIVFVEQDAPKLPTQPFGRGVTPEYKVSQSFDDFLKNKDTQMAFVLSLIKHG